MRNVRVRGRRIRLLTAMSIHNVSSARLSVRSVWFDVMKRIEPGEKSPVIQSTIEKGSPLSGRKRSTWALVLKTARIDSAMRAAWVAVSGSAIVFWSSAWTRLRSAVIRLWAMAAFDVSPRSRSFMHISTKSVRAAIAQKGSDWLPSDGISAAPAATKSA